VLAPETGRRPGFVVSVAGHDAKHHRQLDISVGISGPHDFAVRLQRRPSSGIACVHRIPCPTFVTVAKRPSYSGVELGEVVKVICPTAQGEFCGGKPSRRFESKVGLDQASLSYASSCRCLSSSPACPPSGNVRKPTNRFGTSGFDQSRTAAFASISADIAEIAPDSRPARIAGPKLRCGMPAGRPRLKPSKLDRATVKRRRRASCCHKKAIVTLIERPQLGDAEATCMHHPISVGNVAVLPKKLPSRRQHRAVGAIRLSLASRCRSAKLRSSA